jgi:nucleoside-diphosphate-sugar epimerase
MRILLTGANGFLGGYVAKALTGHDVVTVGLSGCSYNVDLSKEVPQLDGSFDRVIHAAGLAHRTPKSDHDARLFFDVNVKGTLNLLAGIEKTGYIPSSFVFISSVAVYGVETGENIDEEAPLNGSSPYALSKIEAEAEVERWSARNNVKALILRLPLLAGTDPPGNLGAMIRAIKRGRYFRIGEGSARRSIVLAEDVATLISSSNIVCGTYNLTDGTHPSLRELGESISSLTHGRIRSLPCSFTKAIACIGDIIPIVPINSAKLSKLTSTLTFSDAKARREIRWNPRPVIGNLEVHQAKDRNPQVVDN